LAAMKMVRRLRWWGGGGSGVKAVVVVAAVVGVVEAGRRVVESGIWDRIDRKAGNIFGFAGNPRRKSFPTATVWWPAVVMAG
nr:hypothetical protein [Tanacetum cinerariifolium]